MDEKACFSLKSLKKTSVGRIQLRFGQKHDHNLIEPVRYQVY
jgi:hypothetical protein